MLSRSSVTVRHMLLVAGAVGVLGLVIYLAIEVSSVSSSTPAAAPRAQSETREPVREDRVEPAAPPASRVAQRAPIATRAPERAVAAPPEAEGAVETVTPQRRVMFDRTSLPKLDAMMNEANKHYDRQEFDEAKAMATRVLAKSPGNARMLRILVSVACIDNDPAEAQKHYQQLAEKDRADMRRRCQQVNGISFTE